MNLSGDFSGYFVNLSGGVLGYFLVCICAGEIGYFGELQLLCSWIL